MVLDLDDLVTRAEAFDQEPRHNKLEVAITSTLHALREEFHSAGTRSNRQDVLDLISVLLFAHVTSIDTGGRGLGKHLRVRNTKPAQVLNEFVRKACDTHFPNLPSQFFFTPLPPSEDRFAERLIDIFDKDGAAFRELHTAGRDDLINEVFSRFLSTSFVDEKEMGQYLTPPEVVRFMVDVGLACLSPAARKRLLARGGRGAILDPSCGVGSFIAEISRRLYNEVRHQKGSTAAADWLSSFVSDKIVGIDKSDRMVRLATINMGLFGVARPRLVLGNALDSDASKELLGSVELILTNPPFGATYSAKEIRDFDMGQGRARAESEILFLERYIDWLAPGGIVVSVVPDSVLVNRGAFHRLRCWLRERSTVEAVISLPPVTFAASGTTTKTSVLVLRKRLAKSPQLTYFAEAREIGYNVVTRSGQRRRVRTAHNDLPQIAADFLKPQSDSSGRGRHLKLAKDAARWDAAHHSVATLDEGRNRPSKKAANLKVVDLADLVDERIDPRKRGVSFDYIEISDVDPRTGIVGHKRMEPSDTPSRARKLVRVGDVLMSTVRPERGAVGVVPSHLDGAICSTGFAVLRCHSNVHPHTLAALLTSECIKRQMLRNNIGIAYPAIAEDACLDFTVPADPSSIRSLTADAKTLEKSQKEFESARRTLGEAIKELDTKWVT